eukprot:g37122.t1
MHSIQMLISNTVRFCKLLISCFLRVTVHRMLIHCSEQTFGIELLPLWKCWPQLIVHILNDVICSFFVSFIHFPSVTSATTYILCLSFVQLAQGPDGQFRGFAVVEYEAAEQAEQVQKETDGLWAMNRGKGLLPEPNPVQILNSLSNPATLQLLLNPLIHGGTGAQQVSKKVSMEFSSRRDTAPFKISVLAEISMTGSHRKQH